MLKNLAVSVIMFITVLSTQIINVTEKGMVYIQNTVQHLNQGNISAFLTQTAQEIEKIVDTSIPKDFQKKEVENTLQGIKNNSSNKNHSVATTSKKATEKKSTNTRTTIQHSKKPQTSTSTASQAKTPKKASQNNPSTDTSNTQPSLQYGKSLADIQKDSVVNILCTSVSGNLITVRTGSGVVIDPQGIILTNAHVAQDLLFKDNKRPPVVDCVIRQGRIVKSVYKADVFYIPLSWAQQNKGIFNNNQAKGTGRGDYALLAITKSAYGDIMPDRFEYIPILNEYRDPTGETVTAIGYPAESLVGSPQAGVPLKFAVTKIIDSFTLEGATADILETDANPVAERGSSGGAIIDNSGKLIGLIVATQKNNQGQTNIDAISLPYIVKNMSKDGIQLDNLSGITSNIDKIISNFVPQALEIRDLVSAEDTQ